jgi:hypothetical protein
VYIYYECDRRAEFGVATYLQRCPTNDRDHYLQIVQSKAAAGHLDPRLRALLLERWMRASVKSMLLAPLYMYAILAEDRPGAISTTVLDHS